MTAPTDYADDGRPIAWATSRVPNPTNTAFVVLAVACPICRGTHFHGGHAGDLDHGHRAAHCPQGYDRGRGYVVREHPRTEPVSEPRTEPVTPSLLELLDVE